MRVSEERRGAGFAIRFAIDFSSVRTTGTRVYTEGFLPALGTLAGEGDHFLILASADVIEEVRHRVPPSFDLRPVRATRSVPLRVAWQQTALPGLLRAWRADVLFAGFDIAPLLAPCPVLLAIRNPTPALLAGGHLVRFPRERLKGILHRALVFRSCQKAVRVVFPTVHAAREIGGLLKVPEHKRAVVYHGLDQRMRHEPKEPFLILRRYGLTTHKYLLFVSQLYPQKHPQVLVKGFAAWRRRSGRTDVQLAVAGDVVDAGFGRWLRRKVEELEVTNAVRFLGSVARTHLVVLYQHALAFVLPSIVETFGQPYVEAMCAGTPVVAADTGFARELCEQAAIYFAPGNAEDLSRVLDLVTRDPKLREALREKGQKRSRMFSWEREAAETLDLMREVGGSRTRATGLRA